MNPYEDFMDMNDSELADFRGEKKEEDDNE